MGSNSAFTISAEIARCQKVEGILVYTLNVAEILPQSFWTRFRCKPLIKLARNALEWAVGVSLALAVSLAIFPLAVLELGYYGPILLPVVIQLVNYAIGFVLIRRTFRMMGWAIIGTGISSSVFFSLLGPV